jgi:succinoglycan biosynthesis transport protein ExoP
MNLHQFLLILKARWRVAVYTLLATVTVTLGVSLILPKQYTATATVLVDVKSPDPVAGVVLPALVMPGYMATQVDIINSDRVAMNVVRLLKLNQNAMLNEQWHDATNGQGNFDYWIGNLLQKKLDVKPSRESNVITINYKAPDPAFAAAIANAFAQAYIEANIDLKVEPARQYATWFQNRSTELRANLETAQKRLTEYQQQHGIIASDERLDTENQKLAEMQSQLVVAMAQHADSSSKRASAGGDTLPEVMQSGVVMQLKSDVARAEAKLQELAGNLGKNHPQYQRAESELAALKEQVASETRRVSSSIDTAGRISRGKETEIRANIEQVKQRILDLKKGRGEFTVLQQEVDTAQKAFDAVSQRVNQSNLESQTTQTNISVLSPAVEPTEPSFPKLILNIALSIFLGTMLGVGAALTMELTDRRVRSRDDIEQALHLNVLAELAAK